MTDTIVQPDGVGDKRHRHFYSDAAGLVRLFAGIELLCLEDIGNDGAWHWHLVAELR